MNIRKRKVLVFVAAALFGPLWQAGLALEGPDSDALKGDLRERRGQGVHFSGQGLREHAARWAEKIAPWLEAQLDPSARQVKLARPTPEQVAWHDMELEMFIHC